MRAVANGANPGTVPLMPTTTTPVPAQLTDGLNPEQHEAVVTLSGPLLVVAGPGSGKTRVLTHRIAALLATGTSPGAVLALTFTNKAAAEMRTRVAGLVGADLVSRMWIATFHSACVRILRAHHEVVGLPRSFSILDANDAAKLVTDCLEKAGELRDLPTAERKKVVKDTYRMISTAKNADMGAADLLASHNPDTQRAGRIMTPYNAALRARGAVDFDDILLLVMHLLARNPAIAEHYGRRFSHVLIDEFQDTNTVQWEITRMLGAQGNVCVVGDADQSIYAFRGADPGVLGAFTRTFPTAKVVRLGRNYRSTKNIVAVAQAIIDPNPAQHRARMSTDNPAGEVVRVMSLMTDLDEARWVADEIARRGGQLGDHAVLVRTNAQTRALEMILRERGVEHDVVGTVRFFDRAEVKDAMAYLRLTVNPIDVGALERAVAAPRRGIGPATLVQVSGAVQYTGVTVTAALSAAAEGTGRGPNAIRKFVTALEAVTQAAVVGGPEAALRAVLEDAGLLEHYEGKDAKKAADGENAEKAENLRELVRSAGDFVAGRAGTDAQGRVIADLDPLEQVEAFIEHAALMSSAEKPDDPTNGSRHDNAVQVATMHAAKGKEWPHVYVVGVEEGICPHSRAETTAELAEERRLMFVAVSRAQRTLDLTHVALRRKFNDDVEASPSRYLDDLPDGVEFADVAPTRPRMGFSFAAAPRTAAPRAGAGAATSPRGTWAPPPAARGAAPWSASGPRPAPTGAPVRVSRPSPLTPHPDSLNADQVPPGTVVVHPTFGQGTVADVSSSTVTIRFSVGLKVLALARAPLTLAS